MIDSEQTSAVDTAMFGCDSTLVVELSRAAPRLGEPAPHPAANVPDPATAFGGVAGVVIGTVVAMTQSAQPLVEFAGNPHRDQRPIQARSLVPLTQSDLGRQGVLAFELNDPQKPILLGLIHSSSAKAKTDETIARGHVADVSADGDRLLISAEKEIVLRCGEASITLTRAGKVIIRGTYLLSRSSGVNSIKGGSIQLN